MPTVHLVIKGKVQGVFFRAGAKERADALAVKGWIKNTETGEVEALASGSEDQLQNFIDWCKRGPSRANVTDVVINYKEEEQFNEFRVLRR